MPLTSLPVELLETIFECLPQATLARLASTCTTLNASANRFLYRHLSLSSFARNLAAVTTLAQHPHLARHVRTFSLTIDDKTHATIDGSYYVSLARALHTMQDVTSISLHLDEKTSWVLQEPDGLASITSYVRLRQFTSSYPFDKHMASFLSQTPSLETLQVASSSDVAELAPSSVPHLSAYSGPSSLLFQLLPTRPLTSLHLSGDLTLKEVEYLAAASRAPSHSVKSRGCQRDGQRGDSGVTGTAQIKTLSTITSAPPVQIIEALAQACPTLASLRVITTCAFWETPDVSFYARIASTLASLPSLGAFELSGMHWELRPKLTRADCGMFSEKEWVSPPVSPRPSDVDTLEGMTRELDFEGAFMEWAY